MSILSVWVILKSVSEAVLFTEFYFVQMKKLCYDTEY